MSDHKPPPFPPMELGAIVSAYTGNLCGNFDVLHAYAERKLGRSVWVHEFGNRTFVDALRAASKPESLKIAAWCGGSDI